MGPGDGSAGPYDADQSLFYLPDQDPYCTAQPQQIPSVLWDLGHPTRHWYYAECVSITSHDEEDDGAAKFYIP
eukprot:12884989-Prorocentrum_lima.AAC.1